MTDFRWRKDPDEPLRIILDYTIADTVASFFAKQNDDGAVSSADDWEANG